MSTSAHFPSFLRRQESTAHTGESLPVQCGARAPATFLLPIDFLSHSDVCREDILNCTTRLPPVPPTTAQGPITGGTPVVRKRRSGTRPARKQLCLRHATAKVSSRCQVALGNAVVFEVVLRALCVGLMGRAARGSATAKTRAFQSATWERGGKPQPTSPLST